MYVLRESILHKLNNVRYWHKADRFGRSVTIIQQKCQRSVALESNPITSAPWDKEKICYRFTFCFSFAAKLALSTR